MYVIVCLDERRYIDEILWVMQIRQRKRNCPNYLAVNIYFWFSINARVINFESQHRGQRLRLNWKLKCGVFLVLSTNLDCLCREGCCDGSKILNVVRERMQRRDR